MKEKFFEFLKQYNLYDEEVINYISTRMIIVDYDREDAKDYIGCFYTLNHDIVTGFRLCVPKMVDDKTVSINIHEYVHLLNIYKCLGSEYKEDKFDDLLPVLYEFIYLNENDPETLEERREFIMKSKYTSIKRMIYTCEDNKILKKTK